MSKTGQWVFEMQEDAEWMSRDVFIRKHGIMAANFYDDYQEEYLEPDFEMEMDDGA
tara:strand:+ start:2007 stop:2174 length:168 start_codon:yes stop_codon:yes gene_type:complete